MKCAVRLATAVIAVAGLGTAQAISVAAQPLPTSNPWSPPRLDFNDTARFISDTQINVQATVQCWGGSNGLVTMHVDQAANQSANGTAANGNGYETVRCDGTKVHLIVVVASNFGPGARGFFNAGKATASASLYSSPTYPPTGSATASDGPDTIRIVL